MPQSAAIHSGIVFPPVFSMVLRCAPKKRQKAFRIHTIIFVLILYQLCRYVGHYCWVWPHAKNFGRWGVFRPRLQYSAGILRSNYIPRKLFIHVRRYENKPHYDVRLCSWSRCLSSKLFGYHFVIYEQKNVKCWRWVRWKHRVINMLYFIFTLYRVTAEAR